MTTETSQRHGSRDHESFSLTGKVSMAMTFALLGGMMALLVGLPGSEFCDGPAYNSTYPLTEPQIAKNGDTIFRIAVITDLDENSKVDAKTWQSHMRYGHLTLSEDQKRVSISWEAKTRDLKSTLAQGGRSMELSDFVIFDGKLLSVDDRTGVVYRISDTHSNPIPWVLLADGDGTVAKGFKAEWMTVKDRKLYVGGLGKEWTTTTGEFQNYNPMFVKTVTHTGYVEHLDWVENYKAIRRAAGIEYPGYMIHESAQWSEIQQQWFFLPRRASKEMYTEADDEHRATNYLITADAKFNKVEAKHFGPLSNTRGFSAFQFVPGTHDEIMVALKSEEDRGTIRSYITVLTLHGDVLYPETLLEGSWKFEGIAFV